MIEQNLQGILFFFQHQPGATLLGKIAGAPACLLFIWVLVTLALIRVRTRAIKTERDREFFLRQSAERANLDKAQFLLSMGHEIQAPMNAIIGFTDLALRADVPPEIREYLETVRTSADWLTHLVNDILEFSRLETGRLQLNKRTFSLSHCIQSTIKIVQPEAAAKALLIRYKIDARIPDRVVGDQMRLRQILFHLLSNAVSLASSGSIVLVATLESKSADAFLVRIAVADTDIGIPLHQQSHVFDQSWAEENGHLHPFPGRGLAIARKLTELMGGTMEVNRQIGAGSTFQFTAWFEKAQHENSQRPDDVQTNPVARQISILVAEDDAINRMLITKVLESAGHRVVSVANGKEAVSSFGTEIFDLIFMDLEMPDMDGLEATRTIRLYEPKQSHIAIYALTAHTTAEDRERCLQAGMDGVLPKPLEINDVLNTVARVASTSEPRPPATEPAPQVEPALVG